jgi:hypothetical protein
MKELISSPDLLKEGMASNGIDSFLEGSMTANVVAAPVEKMVQVFPDAALYTNQMSPRSTKSSKTVIIGLSIGGFLLLGGVAAILVIAYRLAMHTADSNDNLHRPPKNPDVPPEDTNHAASPDRVEAGLQPQEGFTGKGPLVNHELASISSG